VDVRRSDDRTSTFGDRLVSRHSFAFGPHYDPDNLGFGVLVAHNEDLIDPGGGYGQHPHRDMEIVTWVLSGSLRHSDSGGATGVVAPGVVQRLSAGSGVQHSERNDGGASLHMVQMWIRPSVLGLDPAYAQGDVSAALAGGSLVPIVSGRSAHRFDAVLPLAQSGAAMSAARLVKDASILIPDAALVHLFVTRGSVRVETDAVPAVLQAGDAGRLIRGQGELVTALGDAEVLVWELHGAES
jgi:redox-sensitive bicupin YhaK (pirin superfamily)